MLQATLHKLQAASLKEPKDRKTKKLKNERNEFNEYMKINKRIFKIITLALIQVFAMMDFAWCGGNAHFQGSRYDNLSPALHINISEIQEIFKKDKLFVSKIEKDNDNVFSEERLLISTRMFFHGGVEYWNVSLLLHNIFGQLDYFGRKTGKDKKFNSCLDELEKLLIIEQKKYQDFMREVLYKKSDLTNKKILNQYNELWRRFADWFPKIDALIAEIEKNPDDLKGKLTKDELCELINSTKTCLDRLKAILPFLLVRLPQAELKHDETIEVNAMIKDIHIKAKEAHFKDKEIPALHIKSQHKYFITNTDAFTLQVAIERLISNGVHLGIKNIYITINEEGIIIEDDGKGIDSSYLEDRDEYNRQRIFWYGQSTRGGKGVGMCLLWHIIKLMGAEIEARNSDKYKGAKFMIKITFTAASSAGDGVLAAQSNLPENSYEGILNWELIEQAI